MKKSIENSMSFGEYVNLIDDLLTQGKSTGENQSEEMFNYGKLNRQRMKRLERTITLSNNLVEKLAISDRKMIWLIITEGWCGDAAQNIPIIEKMASASSNIETRYILRDENLELIDQYLTNNARSIPKLIVFNAETLGEIGTWGPRPQKAMEYFQEQRDSGMEKPQIMENIQRWYIADKERSIQQEFEELLNTWGNSSRKTAKAKLN